MQYHIKSNLSSQLKVWVRGLAGIVIAWLFITTSLLPAWHMSGHAKSDHSHVIIETVRFQENSHSELSDIVQLHSACGGENDHSRGQHHLRLDFGTHRHHGVSHECDHHRPLNNISYKQQDSHQEDPPCDDKEHDHCAQCELIASVANALIERIKATIVEMHRWHFVETMAAIHAAELRELRCNPATGPPCTM